MVGESTTPSSFTVYVNVNDASQRRDFSQRRIYTAAAVATTVACATLLALAVVSPSDDGGSVAMAEKQSHLVHLEEQYAQKQLTNKIVHAAVLGCPADVKALAANIAARSSPSSLGTSKLVKSQQLAADCARKETYSTVLKQFQELHANITKAKDSRTKLNADLKSAQDDSYNKWLAAESTYRDSQSKMKTAEDAAKFARGELQKYAAAVDDANKHIQDNVAPLAHEKASLATQKQLIATISELVKALPTAASAESRAELLAEIRTDLKSLHGHAGSMSAQGQRQLAAFAHASAALDATTSNVDPATVDQALKILAEMTSTIDTRLSEIDTATSTAQSELSTNQEHKKHWQIKVVEVSNLADEAAAAMRSGDLQRSTLAGIYTVAQKAYEDEAAAFAVDKGQFETELKAISAVTAKISEVLGACSAPAKA